MRQSKCGVLQIDKSIYYAFVELFSLFAVSDGLVEAGQFADAFVGSDFEHDILVCFADVGVLLDLFIHHFEVQSESIIDILIVVKFVTVSVFVYSDVIAILKTGITTFISSPSSS